MITKFSLKNFKSVQELITIDFTSKDYNGTNNFSANIVKEFNNEKIMRLNFFYGKNGAGKSTIVQGIKELKRVALSIPGIVDDEKFGNFFPNIVPFKLCNNIDNNTFLSLDFYSDHVKYKYSILFDTLKFEIIDEVLHKIENENLEILYSKHEKNYGDLTKVELERLLTYGLEKTSILSLLNEKIKLSSIPFTQHIKNVRTFFSNIAFDFIDMNYSQSLASLISNKEHLLEIEDNIKKFDLSIQNIEVSMRELSFEDYISRFNFIRDKIRGGFLNLLKENYENEKIEYKLDFIHNKKSLNYDEESDGTKAIANILFSLVAFKSKVWVIDDFENDLHTEAATELIKYISENIIDSQFIFITHELSFLNLSEVHHKASHYFVERDNTALRTTIKYLTQFKDLRSDDRNSWLEFYKKYRLGQYPNIIINQEHNNDVVKNKQKREGIQE